MNDKRNSYSEYQLERKLGGEQRYNALWWALADIGLRAMSYFDTETTIVFGMDETKSYKVEISNVEFFKWANDASLSPEDIAQKVLSKLKSKNTKIVLVGGKLPTASLVWSSKVHRALWVLTVNLFGGFPDRLFDDCHEMGDGKQVASIVSYITNEGLITDIKSCTAKGVTVVAEKLNSSPAVPSTIIANNIEVSKNHDLFGGVSC